MTPGQIVSIIVSVIITSIIVTFSIVTNTPKEIISGGPGDVNDGGTANRNESSETFSLQDIIKSI